MPLVNYKNFNTYVSPDSRLNNADDDLQGWNALSYNKDNIDALRKMIDEKSDFGSEKSNQTVKDEMIYSTALGLADQERANKEADNKEVTENDNRKAIDKYVLMLQGLGEDEAANKAEKLDASNVANTLLLDIPELFNMAGKAINGDEVYNANANDKEHGKNYTPILGGIIDLAATTGDLDQQNIKTAEGLRKDLGYTNDFASGVNAFNDALSGMNESLVSPLSNTARNIANASGDGIVQDAIRNTIGSKKNMGGILDLAEDIALTAVGGPALGMAKVGAQTLLPTIAQDSFVGKDRITGEQIEDPEKNMNLLLGTLATATAGIGGKAAASAAEKTAKAAGEMFKESLGKAGKQMTDDQVMQIGKALTAKKQTKGLIDKLPDQFNKFKGGDAQIKNFLADNGKNLGIDNKIIDYYSNLQSGPGIVKTGLSALGSLKDRAKNLFTGTKTFKEVGSDILEATKDWGKRAFTDERPTFNFNGPQKSGARSAKGRTPKQTKTPNIPASPSIVNETDRIFEQTGKKIPEIKEINFDDTSKAAGLQPEMYSTLNKINTLKDAKVANPLATTMLLGNQAERNALSAMARTLTKGQEVSPIKNLAQKAFGKGSNNRNTQQEFNQFVNNLNKAKNLNTSLGKLSNYADEYIWSPNKGAIGKSASLKGLEKNAEALDKTLASFNNATGKNVTRSNLADALSKGKTFKDYPQVKEQAMDYVRRLQAHSSNGYLPKLYSQMRNPNKFFSGTRDIWTNPNIGLGKKLAHQTGQVMGAGAKVAVPTVLNMGANSLAGNQGNYFESLGQSLMALPLAKRGLGKINRGAHLPKSSIARFGNMPLSTFAYSTIPGLTINDNVSHPYKKEWVNTYGSSKNLANDIDRASLTYYANLINNIYKLNQQAVERAKRRANG